MSKDSFANTNKIEQDEELTENTQQSTARVELIAWVMDKVRAWERYRIQNFKLKWDEYYRLWRGVWTEEDRTRDSERSRIISPALQQAIESAVAEYEEAVFGNKNWFDIPPDVDEKDHEQMDLLKQRLMEDMELHAIPAAVSEIFLISAIYGTGIGKIIVDDHTKKSIKSTYSTTLKARVDGVQEEDTVICKLEAVMPENFVIDPSVTKNGTDGINQALGCAHMLIKPKHEVTDKQKSGDYYDVDIGVLNRQEMVWQKGEIVFDRLEDKCGIIEYYGQVPKRLLDLAIADSEEFETLDADDPYEEEYVEAMITIANEQYLLKATENEFLMRDRPFVAYPFDIVPNRFWGRGVAEKGYNAQKTLDAMIRAQLDGLALSVHPMMAVDATRIPRGTQFKVGPGKNLFVNGDPNTAIKEFRFTGIDPMSYNATSDMERYIQMGTGAMDSASPLRVNRRNETLGGMSMMMGGMLKRSKRTLQNIDRNFISPLITKMMWRYMQFYPEKYPPNDFKFRVNGTLGLMAREVESQQLTSLMNIVPPESPAFFAILQGIIENTNITNKEMIKAAIQQSMQPNPQQQQKAQMDMQHEQLQLQEIDARTKLKRAQTVKTIEQLKQDQVNHLIEVMGGQGTGSPVQGQNGSTT